MRRIPFHILMIALILSLSSQAVYAQPEISALPHEETLIYDVRWLGFAVGTAVASIKGTQEINGRKCYVLEIIAKTNDFCSRIYKIEDRYVSYLDAEKLYPLRHEVYRRDGRYKKDAITDFDHASGKAYFRNLLDKSQKTIDIPPGVQDPVSMAYYYRSVPIEAGRKEEFRVYNNESVYDLYGVAGKNQIVYVPHMGKINVFCVRPYAKLKGEMVRKGSARIYFSVDDKKVPVIGIASGPVFTEVVGYLREAR